MQYIIYKLTNKINAKCYIGRTHRGLPKRLGEHLNYTTRCRYLKNAIDKYGIENFDIEIIDSAKDDEKLARMERFYILKYNSMVPNGYNLTLDTDQGRVIHPKTRMLMSESAQGKNHPSKKWSKYIGVKTRKNMNCYLVRVTRNGKSFTKYYPSEIEAAEAYDKIAIYLYGWNAVINFFEKIAIYRSTDLKQFFKDFCKKQKRTSKYVGVSYAPYLKKNKWRAVIYKNGKQINIGVFENEEEANTARCKYLAEVS